MDPFEFLIQLLAILAGLGIAALVQGTSRKPFATAASSFGSTPRYGESVAYQICTGSIATRSKPFRLRPGAV